MPNLAGSARNIAIAHRDWMRGSATVLSGDSWSPTLPLAHLRDHKLSRIARSTTPHALDPHVLVDFGPNAPPPVTGVLIPRHNLSATARWRIRLGGDPDFAPGETAYDTRAVLGSTTSSTALAMVSPATVVLTVTANLVFFHGVAIRLARAGDPATVLEGRVVDYVHDGRRLVVQVERHLGTGVHSDWIVTRLEPDLPVWPSVISFGGPGLWWGGDYTWGGRLAVGEEYRPPAVHLIPLATGNPDPLHQRYLRLDLSDPENPDGRIDLGQLVVSPVWQPSVNAQFGWELEWIDESPRMRSRGGQVYVDARPAFRRLTLTLSELGRDEIYAQGYELQRRLGLGKPAVVVVDPTDPTHLHRLTLYGALQRTTPIRHDHHDSYSMQLIFEEWL